MVADAGDIRKFLALVVPWPTAQQPGYVGIHSPFKRPNSTVTTMPGRAFNDHAKAANFVEWKANNVFTDQYVCMALLQHKQDQLGKDGKVKWKIVRNKEYVLLLQAWWIDVDLKNGFFRDPAHALRKFGRWRRSVGLPEPSLIVFTGGGFHIYYVLDAPVSRETWLPLAHALRNAGQSFKPLPGPDGKERALDWAVTINEDRILRIPGTANYKYSPPVQAQIVHEGPRYPLDVIEKALAAYKVAHVLPVSQAAQKKQLGKPSPVFGAMAKPAPLHAGIDEYAPEIEDVIRGGCKWIERVHATHGAGIGENEWRQSLRVAYYCRQGEEVAHELSDGHATYSEAETDEKMKWIGTYGAGWPQCQTIHDEGGVECKTCPNFRHGKSPLNFARPAPVTPIVVNPATPVLVAASVISFGPLPVGYKHLPDGVIVKLATKDDEVDEKVCEQPLYNIRPQAEKEDGSGIFAITFTAALDEKRTRDITIPYSDVTDSRSAHRIFAKQGLLLSDRPHKLVRNLLTSFVEKLWQHKQSMSDSEVYGWALDKDRKVAAFCSGGMRHNCAGNTPITPIDQVIGAQCAPTGSLDVWQRNCELITSQGRPELDAIIAASFGAPLVFFTGFNGFVIAAFGDTGLGKSFAMRIGLAVWSHPGQAMGGFNDTGNYINNRLGMLRNLPFYYDEMRTSKSQDLANIVFEVTQGRTKGRLGRNSEAMKVMDFKTLLVTASNDRVTNRLYDQIKTTTAGIARIYEFEVQPNLSGLGLISSTQAQRINGSLDVNFGRAGEVYADFLGQNISAVENGVAQLSDKLNDQLKPSNDERFYIAAMTVIIAGAQYANSLGLTKFDIPRLVNFLIQNFYRLRSEIRGSTADLSKSVNLLGIVSEFVNSNRKGLIVTDKVWRASQRPPQGFKGMPLTPMYDAGKLNLVAHAVRDDQLLRISYAGFMQWVEKEKRMSAREVMSRITNELKPKDIKTTIGVNSDYAKTARERVLEFDLSTMPDFFDFT